MSASECMCQDTAVILSPTVSVFRSKTYLATASYGLRKKWLTYLKSQGLKAELPSEIPHQVPQGYPMDHTVLPMYTYMLVVEANPKQSQVLANHHKSPWQSVPQFNIFPAMQKPKKGAYEQMVEAIQAAHSYLQHAYKLMESQGITDESVDAEWPIHLADAVHYCGEALSELDPE